MPLLLFITWNAPAFLSAELSYIDPGFYSYGARAAALGSACTSLSFSPVVQLWNPAGINSLAGIHNISFDHAMILDLVSYNYAGYAHRAKRSAYALGMTYSGDAALAEYSAYVTVAGNLGMIPAIDNSDFQILRTANMGINFRYVGFYFGNNADGAFIDDEGYNHQVKGQAHGMGMDLGLMLHPVTGQRLGIMWRNLLSEIWWHSRNETGTALGNYRENMSSSLQMGYSLDYNNVLLAFDYHKAMHRELADEFRIGLEYRFFAGIFSLRTGYSQETFSGGNRKVAAGTGFRLEFDSQTTLEIDLAYLVITSWEGHNSLLISINLTR